MISRRARLAPRQKCGPPAPKPTCGRLQRAGDVEAVRVGEHPLVAVGRVVPQHDLVAGGDLLTARARCPRWPCAGSGSPASPSGRSPRRRSWCAPSKSSHQSSRWSGWSVSAFIPWLIALRVVSLPATTRRMKNEPNSCVREPLAVDLGVHQHRREVVGGVGPAVLAERLGVGEHLQRRRASGCRSEPPYSGSPAPRMTFVQRNTCCVSSAGMPIISQMISSGSGAAIASTKSHSPSGCARACGRRRRRPSSLTYCLDPGDLLRREALGDDRPQPVVLRVVHVDHRAEELVELDGQVADVRALARSRTAAGCGWPPTRRRGGRAPSSRARAGTASPRTPPPRRTAARACRAASGRRPRGRRGRRARTRSRRGRSPRAAIGRHGTRSVGAVARRYAGRCERSRRAPQRSEETAMPEAVIVATARSPIGRASKGSLVVDPPRRPVGADRHRAAGQGAAAAARPTIEDLIMGCGQPAGEAGFNIARVVAVLAGLDDVPGVTVNRYCSSSLQTIRMAAHAIKAGEGDCFIAAGVETVSRYGIGRQRHGAEPGLQADAGERTAERAPGRPAGVDAARGPARHLHRHGPDRRERRARSRASPARRWTSSPSCSPGPRRRERRERLLRRRDHAGDAARRHGRVARTTARGPAPRSRGSAS